MALSLKAAISTSALWLEATGFAVDPVPLCMMLRLRLWTQEHLTFAETAVWLHPNSRHCSAPQIRLPGPGVTADDSIGNVDADDRLPRPLVSRSLGSL